MLRVEYSKLRFLVVDDNTYMRRILKALLHGLGAREVMDAEDGASGLEIFATTGPDIVLTDWEMPVLNGIQMTRMMRSPEKSTNPFVPIIMVTVHSERSRVLEARDAGVTDFLVKPVSARLLHQRILNIVSNPRPFVRTGDYVGPDRRRFEEPDYKGLERRGAQAELISAPSLERGIADQVILP